MISKDATNLNKKTLDVQHHNKMQNFNENHNLLNSMKNKLAKLKTSYDKLNSKLQNQEDKEAAIQKLINLRDEIVNLETQIKNIENSANEVEYLINTGNILFKYYV